jgi:hypothetical protein
MQEFLSAEGLQEHARCHTEAQKKLGKRWQLTVATATAVKYAIQQVKPGACQ